MIALAILVIGFLVAWKMSLRVTLWGGCILLIMLAFYGVGIWSAATSTPEDIFMANYVPESEQGAEFSPNLVNRILLGYFMRVAVLVLSAYTVGGLIGWFALSFKKEKT